VTENWGEIQRKYPTIDRGYSERGADMGRTEWKDAPVAPVRVVKLPLTDGGCYDPGGAYWGALDNLYMATDGAGFRLFTRADNLNAAIDIFKQRTKDLLGIDLEITPGEIGNWSLEQFTDEFIRGYTEALLWTNEPEGLVQSGQWFGEDNWSAEMIDAPSVELIKETCVEFIKEGHEHLAALANDGIQPSTLGHDFWLSSSRYGCGFNDCDWSSHGDMLYKLSRSKPERYVTIYHPSGVEFDEELELPEGCLIQVQ
jgi:hypothetical protein